MLKAQRAGALRGPQHEIVFEKARKSEKQVCEMSVLFTEVWSEERNARTRL